MCTAFLCNSFLIIYNIYPFTTVKEFFCFLAVQYTATIVTSTDMWSGTDANVRIILYGESGVCGPNMFSGVHEDRFETGKTDVFTITCDYLGKLTKINIGM